MRYLKPLDTMFSGVIRSLGAVTSVAKAFGPYATSARSLTGCTEDIFGLSKW